MWNRVGSISMVRIVPTSSNTDDDDPRTSGWRELGIALQGGWLVNKKESAEWLGVRVREDVDVCVLTHRWPFYARP